MQSNKTTHRIIGAHVSTQGGFDRAPKRGKDIGVNGLQIFGASPVRWQANIPTQEEINKFHAACKENGVEVVFLHAPYLINLTSPKETLRNLSKHLLTQHLKISTALDAQGVIFHIGSRGDMDTKKSIQIVIDTVKAILQTVPEGILIVENNAGAGNLVGDSLEELAQIYKGVTNNRFKICIDTAHAFASGMLPSFEKNNIDTFAKKFDAVIGIEAIAAFHINDSKVGANAKKDRHENIGEGFIGKEGIKNFINHSKFMHIPLLLEVPGFEGEGPDKKNVKILKELASSV